MALDDGVVHAGGEAEIVCIDDEATHARSLHCCPIKKANCGPKPAVFCLEEERLTCFQTFFILGRIADALCAVGCVEVRLDLVEKVREKLGFW